ncbi:MAG: hypothetical protein KJS90_04960 [Acidobacteria bacterium]|nr:hypothetical protein [Acidobacteriota bacterium]
MYLTRYSPVGDPALRERLWQLYSRAYARIAESTVTHEMLDRLEFDDQLADHACRTWVAWEDGFPVAMAVVSTDVARTRWLSEQYFRARYPRQFAAGLVHYLVWAVVDPGFMARGASLFLAREAMAAEQREGALLVFDLPEENQPHPRGGGAELMHRMAAMVGGAALVPLTVQRYYALDFSVEAVAEADASATSRAGAVADGGIAVGQ